MIEEDIRPKELMKQKESFLRDDIDFLLARKDRWLDVDCPACQSGESSLFGEKHGFTFRECLGCFSVFTSPRPNSDLLGEFYNSSSNYRFWNDHIFPATEEVRKNQIFKPRVEKVIDELENMGFENYALLEVGAAYGWFCEILQDSGKASRVIAVEPGESLARTCVAKGIETINLPIEDVSMSESVDVVAAFEVIEHLFSPESFVRHMSRLLRPGGAIFMSCPSLYGFDASLLGTESSVFQHEHLNYFHPQSMRKLLERCGFDSIVVSTPGELDVNIVDVFLQENEEALERNEFVRNILRNGSDELKRDLQSFLAKHGLSSHMWVSARKLAT